MVTGGGGGAYPGLPPHLAMLCRAAVPCRAIIRLGEPRQDFSQSSDTADTTMKTYLALAAILAVCGLASAGVRLVPHFEETTSA